MTPGANNNNGDIFISPFGDQTTYANGPEIIDNQGNVIWFHPVPAGQEAVGFRAQIYRDKPVLTWWQGTGLGGLASGTGYIYNDHYQQIATVSTGNGYSTDVNRHTSAINWETGGKQSTFTVQAAPGQVLDNAGEIFAWQHDPGQVSPDTFTWFDNEAAPAELPYSRPVTVQLDFRDKTACPARRSMTRGRRAGPDRLLLRLPVPACPCPLARARLPVPA